MDKKYIGYGIGCTYDSIAIRVKEKITLSYLCDKKWDTSVKEYDNIPIIAQSDILKIENAQVVIFPTDKPVKESIEKELQALGVDYIFVDDLLERRKITGAEIKAEGQDGVWKDRFHNVICFDESLPDDIVVHLWGINNELHFETNIMINKLNIYLGNDGRCRIGENTRIFEASITISYASLDIGKDCMLSTGITIRTDDLHPIFDRITHERVNMPKDVVLHDHVWVGEGATLLSGANIGEGSVVGARTVTSSSFGDHVIVAGVPGKVIRENICWSKDSTARMNYTCLEECSSDDALRYS